MSEENQAVRPSSGKRAHGLGKAAIGISAMAAAAFWTRSRTPGAGNADRTILPPAVSGERRVLAGPVGALSYYVSGETLPGTPLLLLHSINAAGSAYEIKPLYDHYAEKRPLYALDLPGFGFSERGDRLYTPRLMTDAVLAMAEEIVARHGGAPIEALALSLSCEFLARAAVERPALFKSVALISPTGLGGKTFRAGPPGSDRRIPLVRGLFRLKPWRRPFYDLLTTRTSIRYFLQKTWGSKAIDEGLLDYDALTTHQPGAEHVVYCFVSGYLFSNDIGRVYQSLTVPVFMARGTRGDFVDYRHETLFRDRPNWRMHIFETGALPQFEQLPALVAAYEAFIADSTIPALAATP